MGNDAILALLRHGMTLAGGVLVTRGYIGAGDLDLIVGALLTIGSVAWSVIQKRRQVTLREVREEVRANTAALVATTPARTP